MKKLVIILGATIVLSFQSNLLSQNTETTDFQKHSLHVEASGIVNSLGANYQFILNSINKFKPFLGAGIKYFPHTLSEENVYTIYPHIGLLYGNKNHLEASIGAALDFKTADHLFLSYLGYRYQSADKHLIFRAGLTFVYMGPNEDDAFFDLPLFMPTPTIGFGFAF